MHRDDVFEPIAIEIREREPIAAAQLDACELWIVDDVLQPADVAAVQRARLCRRGGDGQAAEGHRALCRRCRERCLDLRGTGEQRHRRRTTNRDEPHFESLSRRWSG